ncbi:unnamed protein product [Haemonchus placei]|uniref:RING-type domain-containing protein n=1 Tax=Haemonchus placei TaxID=6290 RepID=A0A0N4WMI5_HAEPC|nr:unnamed protein product [Haemonchus placei]
MDRPRRNVPSGFSSVLRLSRTPFPSIASYIAISFFISLIALGNIVNVFKTQPEVSFFSRYNHGFFFSLRFTNQIWHQKDITFFLGLPYGGEPKYNDIWRVSINTYFAFLALIAKIIIKLTFKQLTRQEEIIVRLFFDFSLVFLSVVAGAHHSHRVLPWLVWFGIIGFLTVLHDITYQRFKFVCNRLSLFSSIAISHLFGGVRLIQTITSSLRSFHGLLRCLSSSERFGTSPDSVRHFNYWLELSVTIATDAIQLVYCVSPQLISLMISIVNTLARHRKHNQIFLHIQSTYPNEEAEERDLCIVCWEKLGRSRRLPCGHQFHDWCLMWWLAQDGSCPTCRFAVSTPAPNSQQPPPSPHSTTTFRFEFSTGTPALNPFLRREVQQDESQLTGMANQVHEMFPQVPLDAVMEDLRMSGSSQATIENILEGRAGFIASIVSSDSSSDDVVSSSDSTITNSPPQHSASDMSVVNQQMDMDISPYHVAKREMIAKHRRSLICVHCLFFAMFESKQLVFPRYHSSILRA